MHGTHGRTTSVDVREAGLRRWDGRQRITTDWINLFHEPELSFPNGDCFVYLREPGHSKRGPAYRIHSALLQSKGFQTLLDRSVFRMVHLASTECSIKRCSGCENSSTIRELYLPAPPKSTVDEFFDYHITTRNFFAWLYDVPQAGKALGKSLVALKDRLDCYRPKQEQQNKLELLTYAESQRYLDFRECIDHALAILHVSEVLHIERLWVDAFAHVVGMRHRGLRDSIEFEALTPESKMLINISRLELDMKLNKVAHSVGHFFENDLPGSFFGLHAAALEHLDRFRSFLHAFYIEQYGFWPPENFTDEEIQRQTYTSLYFEFRNLYHHLADPKSTLDAADSDVSVSGGVCVRQNIQAFDSKHQYDALPFPIPMLPVTGTPAPRARPQNQRRNSWNIVAKRKQERETRNARCMQALIESTNRDWTLMNCLLVRRYSEFEISSAVDPCQDISLTDARKIRWILVYSILQTLISVVQAPKEVRNTEGLTYSLCCRSPEKMPWQILIAPEKTTPVRNSVIEPDVLYSHTNGSNSNLLDRSSSQVTLPAKERRKTWVTQPSQPPSRPVTARATSLKKLIPKRSDSVPNNSNTKRQSYCEIYVQGYGNGLNEVESEQTASVHQTKQSLHTKNPQPPLPIHKRKQSLKIETKLSQEEIDNDTSFLDLSASSPMSRESSNSSHNSSTWSRKSSGSDTDASTPDTRSKHSVHKSDEDDEGPERILDEKNEMRTVHFNTKTWDTLLAGL